MKKAVSILVCAVTVLSLAGCAAGMQDASQAQAPTVSVASESAANTAQVSEVAVKRLAKAKTLRGEISALTDGVATLKLFAAPAQPGVNNGQNGKGKGTPPKGTPGPRPSDSARPSGSPRPSPAAGSTPPPRPSNDANRPGMPAETYSGEVLTIDLSSASIVLRAGTYGAETETKIDVSALSSGMILEIVYAKDGTTISKVIARQAVASVNS